jgi:putative glutamine amidotransferase
MSDHLDHLDMASGPPLIGVTGGTQLQETAFGFQQTNALNMKYLRAVARAGGLPVLLAPTGTPAADLVARLDGLLIPGGGDLDPARYGETPQAEVYGVDPERDDNEFSLLEAAEARGIPILGLCRGLQLINVSRGGTLIQHVDESHLHWQTGPSHEGAHQVTIVADSLLAQLVGPEELLVNSYHHQAIGRLGEGLRIVAHADGLAEAFETADGLIVGVQWHPEQMIEHHPRQLALFENFVKFTRARARDLTMPAPHAWSANHV